MLSFLPLQIESMLLKLAHSRILFMLDSNLAAMFDSLHRLSSCSLVMFVSKVMLKFRGQGWNDVIQFHPGNSIALIPLMIAEIVQYLVFVYDYNTNCSY